jgi:hypothetical protein
MYKELKIKPYYNSKDDDVLKDFYEPLLSETKKYNRVSAFFDSNIIRFYSKGIEKIVKSNGKINFIFSKQLNEEDYELIQLGYKEREDFINKLSEDLIITDSKEISNLAYLIRIGIVDIKIAFTKEGIFHDKFGLMYDDNGDCLYFRGSNNETVASVQKNFEGFEVSIKNNSEWKDVNGVFVKVEGQWKMITESYIKVNGQWKLTTFSTGPTEAPIMSKDG